jgi:hypothetical protein
MLFIAWIATVVILVASVSELDLATLVAASEITFNAVVTSVTIEVLMPVRALMIGKIVFNPDEIVFK